MENKLDNIDPYAFAGELTETADDLVSDMTSYTVQDIADILRLAAAVITRQADEHNSYRARTRVTLTVGHEAVDLTEEILPMVNTILLQEWVRDAVRARLTGNVSHAHHDHTH